MMRLHFLGAVIVVAVGDACRTISSVNTIVDDLSRDFVRNRPRTDPIKQQFIGGVLRLAFHDAGTYDVRDGSGGPSGCIADERANTGLEKVAQMLEPLYQRHRYSCPSRADFWALAAAAAVDEAMVSTKPRVSLVKSFRWGRRSETTCNYKSGRLPSGTGGREHIVEVFQRRMGFTTRQVVALMGAHTVGKTHQERTGFPGYAWDSSIGTFDNRYYQDMLSQAYVNAHLVSRPNPKFWVAWKTRNPITNRNNFMLRTDMLMAWEMPERNSTPECHFDGQEYTVMGESWRATPLSRKAATKLCEPAPDAYRSVVEEFAQDVYSFQAAFNQAFAKLMSLGYHKKGKTLCSPCSNGRCC